MAAAVGTAPPRPRVGAARWVVRGIVAVIVVGLAYVAFTFFQVWWASRTDDSSPADAIVVLGAAQWNGRPSPVLAERLDHAAELYRQGAARTVVVVGGKQAGDTTTEGKAGYDYLRSKGVPDSALKVEVGGTDTYEEMSATALILRQAKVGNRVLLVTDPYHAHRAADTAREVGLDAHVSPTRSDASITQLARETGASALGRLIGYRRLRSLA